MSRNQVIWGGNYFVEHLTAGHRGWLIWDKGQHGLTMSDAEIAYTSFDFPTRVCIMNRVAIQTDGAIHPAQKPVALYTWVLKTVGAKEGWRILDTHAGSAASLVACERFGGLYYVGFEIDEDYYIKASERLAAEQAQVKIFDMEEKQ